MDFGGPRGNGEIAGRYRVLEPLGKGGMGEVYRAQDLSTGAMVALKRMRPPPQVSKQRAYEAMFEREYHTLCRLRHPRAIEVYEYALSDGGPYYTMELLDGSDLANEAPLPFARACQHLRDVVSVLALLHAHRLVHRDVSPSNVRLTGDGRAKLIDFGALQNFGVSPDVVGTPPCMAPEAAHRMPLDPRTDLYAVGAVAYWALTRRHAYPARQVADLAQAWKSPPPPPSALVADVPPALDRLVLSLLSLDPLGRPATDAAVMEALTAIGGLPVEEQSVAASSYVSSSRMVGREVEMGWLEQRLARARDGQGGDVVLEGSAGIGKTRLLREVGLHARLKGIAVVNVDAEAASAPFEVAARLCERLLCDYPEAAITSAQAGAGVLAHLSEAIAAALEVHAPEPLPHDFAERRARMQGALASWFVAFARTRTLLLCIDNLHAADEYSAAFLAALGLQASQTRLLILLGHRSGDPIVARAPVRAIRGHAARLKLGSLTRASFDELLRCAFGDVPNIGRMARLLHDKSAGNPRVCVELLEWLVSQRIARYAGGTWVLPQEIASSELPAQPHELMIAKLDGLSEHALALARALCVHERPVSIADCPALCGADPAEAYAALDALIAAQVLVGDQGEARFADQAVRQALLARMDDATRKQQHLRAADVLAARDPQRVGARIQVGWHLIQAGEPRRGAELLASIGRPFLMAGVPEESLEHVLEALRAGLAEYEQQGRSDLELANLLLPMVPIAFHSSDWRLIERYGERALDLGLQITGLARARALCGLIGPKLSLAAGLALAARRIAAARKRGLELDLPQAITLLCSCAPSIVGCFALWLDLPATRRVRDKLLPLSYFGPGLPAVVHHFAALQVKMLEGHTAEVMDGFAATKARLHEPKIVQALGETPHKNVYAAFLWGYALLRTGTFGRAALECATELETLGLRFWTMGAAQIRLLYHAFRGEAEDAAGWRERVELLAVQGGTTWQLEMLLPTWLMTADVLTEDTVGARRTAEQLARRATYVPSLQPYAQLAQAAYLTLHGRFDEAIEGYERLMPHFAPMQAGLWRRAHALYARALNGRGSHADARAVANAALAHEDAGEHVLVLEQLELQRQLALAEAGLGDCAAAAARLDRLIETYGRKDNRLLIGLLYRARGEVAIAMADAAGYQRFAREMEWRFRTTRNPPLLAQCERVVELALRAGLIEARSVAPGPHAQPALEVGPTTQRLLQDMRVRPRPRELALRYILQQVGAEAGYLYACTSGVLQLVAAVGGPAPDKPSEAHLLRLFERSRLDELEPERGNGAALDMRASLGDEHTRIESLEPPGRAAQEPEATIIVEPAEIELVSSARQVRLLSALRHGRAVVVGGLIIASKAPHMGRLSDAFLQAIADTLFEPNMNVSASEVSAVQ